MSEEKIQQIPLDKIRPNGWNRRHGGFDQAKLRELADSIKAAYRKELTEKAKEREERAKQQAKAKPKKKASAKKTEISA